MLVSMILAVGGGRGYHGRTPTIGDQNSMEEKQMGIANTCRPTKVNGKVATKETGKGCTLIYLVDTSGCAITGGSLMRIGNKTGHITIEPKVSTKFGFDLDSYGKLKVVAKPGKAVRCR
jgi:hypothetical protein